MTCLAKRVKQINWYHFSKQVEERFSWLLIHVCCSRVTCIKVRDISSLPNPFTSLDYQRVMTMPRNQGQFSSISMHTFTKSEPVLRTAVFIYQNI